MNDITREGVRKLVTQELELASKDHGGKFNSPHEEYGVIKEEVEEAVYDMKRCEFYLDEVWDAVRHDECHGGALNMLARYAIETACEAIQVAAMARKAMR